MLTLTPKYCGVRALLIIVLAHSARSGAKWMANTYPDSASFRSMNRDVSRRVMVYHRCPLLTKSERCDEGEPSMFCANGSSSGTSTHAHAGGSMDFFGSEANELVAPRNNSR